MMNFVERIIDRLKYLIRLHGVYKYYKEFH